MWNKILPVKSNPSQYSLVVGGLGWAGDPDILGPIPTKSSPGLPDTWFWRDGLCIRGFFLQGWVEKRPALVRFHIIKKKKTCEVIEWVMKAIGKNSSIFYHVHVLCLSSYPITLKKKTKKNISFDNFYIYLKRKDQDVIILTYNLLLFKKILQCSCHPKMLMLHCLVDRFLN